MQPIGALAAALVLAVLVESMVEYFAADWAPAPRATKYLAAVAGVGLALGFGVDLLGDVLGVRTGVPFLGEVLSGLIIGRGANYVSDFVGRVRGGPAVVAVAGRRQLGEGAGDGAAEARRPAAAGLAARDRFLDGG